MAIGVTKVHGSSAGVNNVGTGQFYANAKIINTGIASPITAYKLTTFGVTANLAAELKEPGADRVGAVETLLKAISSNASVLAYQVDASGSTAQLSVIVERSGWDSDASMQSVIQALGSNIGAYSTVNCTSAAVTSTGGIKLA